MLTLKINETMEFEELAGVSWARAQRGLRPVLCQRHRLEFGPSSEKGLDKEALAVVNACDECQPAEMPIRQMAALAYLVTKRDEAGLVWEEFIERDLDEVWAKLGNAGAAEAAEPAA